MLTSLRLKGTIWRTWPGALAGLVIVWAVSVPAPGQAVEYGRDLKFTLYSGQGETAAEFKENVILMLHGFASAMPNRTYKALNRAFGATHTVVGFNYDYVDVAANRAELHPQELMRVMQGEHYSERRQMTFQVAEDAVAAYGTVQPVENPRTDMLVLLTEDDEVLRYQDAVRVFSAASRAKIEIFETGGHSPPLDRPDIMAAIRRFVEARSLP